MDFIGLIGMFQATSSKTWRADDNVAFKKTCGVRWVHKKEMWAQTKPQKMLVFVVLEQFAESKNVFNFSNFNCSP